MAPGIIRPSSFPFGGEESQVSKTLQRLQRPKQHNGEEPFVYCRSWPLLFSFSQGAKVLTKPDLKITCQLVCIQKEDEWKTAYITPTENLVMPFGLINAPIVTSTLVNVVLRDMLNISVFVYLDNIFIFSKSIKNHVTHFKIVLQNSLCEN